MPTWDQGDLLFVRSAHSGYEQIGLAFLRCQLLASDLFGPLMIFLDLYMTGGFSYESL